MQEMPETSSGLNLFTAPEAAILLGLSPVRVRQLCQQGRLGRKVGGRWLITQDELDRFAEVPREPGRPVRKDKDHGETET